MPFDGSGFSPGPVPPKRPPRRANGAATLVLVLSVLLLVMPFSLAACSDLMRYAQGH